MYEQKYGNEHIQKCLRGPGCPDPLRQEKRGEGDVSSIPRSFEIARAI
jgi:hypothetical protein